MLIYIYYIVLIIFLSMAGFINACITYFLQFCFREGNVFGRYLPFLAWFLLWNNDRDRLQTLKKFYSIHPKETYYNALCEACLQMPIYKIMGGCGVCFNIWQGAILYFALFGMLYPFEYFYLWFIPFSAISNYLYRAISEE